MSLTATQILTESYTCPHAHRPKMHLWIDTEGHMRQLGYTADEISATAEEIARVENMTDAEYAAYIQTCSECGRQAHPPDVNEYGCIGPEEPCDAR